MRKSIDSDGYVRVDVDAHPRVYRGQVFEHVLVMEEHLGCLLPRSAVVHHRNRNRSDNRIENLMLMRCDEDHWALHRAIDRGDDVLVAAFEESSRKLMAKMRVPSQNHESNL